MADRSCVLVVDDERTERYLLRQYLEREGYDVVEASSGTEGLAILRAGGVDLALFDVMMAGLDGIDLTRLVRHESAIPIILVTARGEESSRVGGLEVGADDYIVKPVSMPEVVARVRALLRRSQGLVGPESPTSTLRAGAIELDTDSRQCTVDGKDVELTRREFDLLAALVEGQGKVLRRHQLLDAAWGTTDISEKTVDVHLTKLRAKLGDAVRVTTLRGVGYRLES